MYPMLLLCLRRLLPLVIAGIGCEGLRASRRLEKCTMRILVHCLLLSFELLLLPTENTLRPGPKRAGTRLRCPSLAKVGIVTLTGAAMSTLSVPRIIDVTEVFQRNLTLDTAKNCFLVYFIAKRALKLWRHVYARGLFRSLRELYVFIAQVFPIYLPLNPPSIETFSLCLREPSGLLLNYRLYARKWMRKWSLRGLRSTGSFYRKARTWYATSPFQRKVVP